MSGTRVNLSKRRTEPLEVSPEPSGAARHWRSVYEDILKGARPAIYVAGEAFSQVNTHAASDLEREVGGMLVGQARRTPQGKLYVVVQAHLPAQQVRHGPAHLTFTSATQVDLLNRLEETFPGKQIVGWYHTHPGMGVFLSSMDVWLHVHFFPKPWQVALVLDPRAGEGGFFCYTAGEQEFLHPQCYVGFHALEWDGADGLAVWRNLLAPEVRSHKTSAEWREADYFRLDEDGLS